MTRRGDPCGEDEEPKKGKRDRRWLSGDSPRHAPLVDGFSNIGARSGYLARRGRRILPAQAAHAVRMFRDGRLEIGSGPWTELSTPCPASLCIYYYRIGIGTLIARFNIP